jgi:hypothetical protein
MGSISTVQSAIDLPGGYHHHGIVVAAEYVALRKMAEQSRPNHG